MKFNITSEFKETKYLTGLRAYAAFAVFFIHSEGLGLTGYSWGSANLANFYKLLVAFGKYGVVVFFVLSAYSIAMSLDQDPQFNFKKYITRRVLRVVPLYYIVITLAFFWGGIPWYFEQFNTTNSWYNLFSHLSFLNLFQIQYRNNLIGVEWSVPIELAYYLILPFLYLMIKKHKTFGLHLLWLSLALSLIGPKFFSNHFFSSHNDLNYHWSLMKYAFSFSFGLLLHHWNKNITEKLDDNFGTIFSGIIFVFVCYLYSGLEAHEEFMAIWTGAVILAVQSRSRLSRLLTENSIAVFIGTISYSFYLLHFPILYILRERFPNLFVASILTLTVTTALSYLTYIFIEKPFIQLGKKCFQVKKPVY